MLSLKKRIHGEKFFPSEAKKVFSRAVVTLEPELN